MAEVFYFHCSKSLQRCSNLSNLQFSRNQGVISPLPSSNGCNFQIKHGKLYMICKRVREVVANQLTSYSIACNCLCFSLLIEHNYWCISVCFYLFIYFITMMTTTPVFLHYCTTWQSKGGDFMPSLGPCCFKFTSTVLYVSKFSCICWLAWIVAHGLSILHNTDEHI